jgi:tetratricopeptide (TPR) repeat protein
MKRNKILTFIILLFVSVSANAQIDAVKIASAKKAIENKDYQIALQTLGEVSNAGRKNKMFLFYSAEAYYNILEFDSAEVYYKKYFLLDITNTDVADKLADIDYKRKKRAEKEKCIKNCSVCSGTGLYEKSYLGTCDYCKGKGKRCYSCELSGKCYRCKGTGQLSNYDDTFRTCPTCDGDGTCKRDHECTYCDGTGKKKKYKEVKCYHPNCN